MDVTLIPITFTCTGVMAMLQLGMKEAVDEDQRRLYGDLETTPPESDAGPRYVLELEEPKSLA
jgi:hypothetical protein